MCRREVHVFVYASPTLTHSSQSRPLSVRQMRLCCSKNRNVTTVCGPRRTKLGTQPRNTQPTPSFRHQPRSKLNIPPLPSALMILVLITSTGLQTVVATKPAPALAAR